MTASSPPPGNGPFATRKQAEHVFAAFRQAAERGRSGPDIPRGERLVFTTHQYLAETIADTLELWGELGDYDREVIARLAGLLDPVEVGVLTSWIYRVMGDEPDNPAPRKDTDSR